MFNKLDSSSIYSSIFLLILSGGVSIISVILSWFRLIFRGTAGSLCWCLNSSVLSIDRFCTSYSVFFLNKLAIFYEIRLLPSFSIESILQTLLPHYYPISYSFTITNSRGVFSIVIDYRIGESKRRDSSGFSPIKVVELVVLDSILCYYVLTIYFYYSLI